MPTYAGIRASDGDVSLTFGRSWAAHSACRAGLKLICRRRAAQNAKEARQSCLLLCLVAPTEGLQERRRLGILHKLALFGCSSFLCGRVLYP